MSAVYLESSALLCWLLGEARASEVVERVNEAKAVVTSVLTLVESERALVRAENRQLLSAADAQRLRGMLHRARPGWVLMDVTDEVRERAARPFPLEPVRTLDAIHLATALAFTAAFPDLTVLTHDARIGDNCEALGLAC